MSNDEYIAKMKQAGQADKIIAARLGLTEEAVKTRWQEMLQAAQAENQVDPGYSGLVNQFNILCQQYALVGQSLKLVGSGLCSRLSAEQLKGAVKDLNLTQDQLLDLIADKYIILPPYTSLDPVALLQESLKNCGQG